MGPEESSTDMLALAQKLVDQSSPLDGKNLPVWLRKAIEERFIPMDQPLITYSVPEAGRFLGLGRSASYEARLGKAVVRKHHLRQMGES